jgi:hypothetical protein
MNEMANNIWEHDIHGSFFADASKYFIIMKRQP